MKAEIDGVVVVDGGRPTEAGIALMRMVHEAAGLGCWHNQPSSRHSNNGSTLCDKCEKWIAWTDGGDYRPKNPAYLTSLDAFRPLWEAIEKNYRPLIFIYHDSLDIIMGCEGDFTWQAHPHHHLEAAARALRFKCVECNASGVRKDKPNYITGSLKPLPYSCTICDGTGEVSILQAWKKEIDHG